MGYFDKFNSKGIPFMEGRDKKPIEEIMDKPVCIVDYGFINGADGPFAVFMVDCEPDSFFFANSIVTEMLDTVDKDGMRDELKTQPIVFTKAVSKAKGREYTRFEFVTEEIPF